MSISPVQRFFAFFDNIWSFILTLVRSLLAFFSFRRRSSDPLVLPRVNRTPKEALARAHARLRPILLTPRAVALSPGYRTQRAPSTRSPSATSTLFLGHDKHAAASGSVPQPIVPQRTSPKLGSHDVELGLSSNTPTASDHTGLSVANVTSFNEGTTDASSMTTPIGSLYVLPLTPPDRCYLAPMPSATDCPYAEPWPTNVAVDRGKPKLPGSPLKVSINTDPAYAESMGRTIGSPPPRHWSPAQIWTSTPYKTNNMVPDPVLSPPDHQTSTMDPAALGISDALVSRSQNCMVQAYDDVSDNTSPSSGGNPLVDGAIADYVDPHYPMLALASQVKHSLYPYPQYHNPDPYACTWRRYDARLPGKAKHAYPRSRSYMDLRASEWYDADAYVPSPNPTLSPPLHSPTDSEDDDEVPLGQLKARLARQSDTATVAVLSASIGFSVPLYADGGEAHTATMVSPRTRRRRSEGCLLAMFESSPTPIGLGARAGRQVVSQVLDSEGYTKDWLEALSLRFSPEAAVPVGQPCIAQEVAA